MKHHIMTKIVFKCVCVISLTGLFSCNEPTIYMSSSDSATEIRLSANYPVSAKSRVNDSGFTVQYNYA
jgi:hypothetical protein